MWADLDGGGIRIDNVYHPNIPAWNKFKDLTPPPEEPCCKGTGTYGASDCSDRAAEYDAQHRALADTIEARCRALEHRMADALLSVLQGQQAILRAIANHDDTDAQGRARLMEAIARRRVMGRKLEIALKTAIAARTPPRPRLFKRAAQLFAWVASFGLVCTAAAPTTTTITCVSRRRKW